MNDTKYSFNNYLICKYRELVLQSLMKRHLEGKIKMKIPMSKFIIILLLSILHEIEHGYECLFYFTDL